MEREDALRGNVEIVDDQEKRVAVGYLEVDMLPTAQPGPLAASVRFVGHIESA